jgi:hypothetical protein
VSSLVLHNIGDRAGRDKPRARWCACSVRAGAC